MSTCADLTTPPEETLRALQLWLSYVVILENHLTFGSYPDGVDVKFSWTSSFDPKVVAINAKLNSVACYLLLSDYIVSSVDFF